MTVNERLEQLDIIGQERGYLYGHEHREGDILLQYEADGMGDYEWIVIDEDDEGEAQ